MSVIGLSFSAILGMIVVLLSPILAMWLGLVLWLGGTSRFGLLLLAIGYTSGALSTSLLRVGFMAVTGGNMP